MMQKILRAVLILTFITNGASAMSYPPQAETAPMIVYSCGASAKVDAGQLEQACLALQASLAKQAGVQTLELLPGDMSVAGQANAFYFQLDIQVASPTLLTGTLTWADCRTGTCGPQTSGDAISVHISDATLNKGSYEQFADTLLKLAKPPL